MGKSIVGQSSLYRPLRFILFLSLIGGVSFAMGFMWSSNAHAAEKADSRTVYPKKSNVDFEGLSLQGELRNPGEFYFQNRESERFDSLVKRRKNFHKEMLRDVVLSK